MVALGEADRAELTRLEEAMWRPETRFDRVFQERHFAPDFVEFGRSGQVYSRDQAILSQASPIRALLPLDALSIRLLDDNVAQVTYFSHVKYGEVIEHARRSSIWSRTDSHWVMRFHQGTPYVPEVEGAP